MAGRAGGHGAAPPAQYVDAAYISAAELAQAQAEDRKLIGPAPASADTVQRRYSTERFDIVVERRQTIWPVGKTNTQCSRLEEKETGKVSNRFEWSTHCENSPLRAQCAALKQKHRSVGVGHHHTTLQVTPEFQRRLKPCNANYWRPRTRVKITTRFSRIQSMDDPAYGVMADGQPITTDPSCSLEEFLPRSVVVEHHGEAVAPSKFASRQVHAEDRLEIVKIVAGG